jgi:hypothetical protein
MIHGGLKHFTYFYPSYTLIMPFITPQNFVELIDRAISSDTPQKKELEDYGVSRNELIEQINEAGDEIWKSSISSIENYDKLEKHIHDLEEKHRNKLNSFDESLLEKKETGPIGGVVVLLGLLLVISPAFNISFFNIISNFLYGYIVSTGLKVFAGFIYMFVIAVLLQLIVYLSWVFKVRIAQKQVNDWQNKHSDIIADYHNSKATLISEKEKITVQIINDSLLEEIIKAINKRKSPSYSLTLGPVEISGLGEVIDPSKTVDTNAKAKLDFLLKNMPGGSIGIAGSRGAGKSTLIQAYCGANRTITTLNDRTIIPVMTSAPVQYEAREFILYLFATTCRSVLKHEKYTEDITVVNPLQKEANLPAKKIVVILKKWTRIFAINAGVLLLIFSISLWYLHNAYHPKPAILAETKNSLLKKDTINELNYKDTLRVIKDTMLRNHINSAVKRNAMLTDSIKRINVIKNSQNVTFFDYYFSYLSSEETTAGRFFSWGILLLISWLIIVNTYKESVINFLPLVYYLYGKKAAPLDEPLQESSVSLIAKTANERLKEIKFQQTFTNGWSGNLKLPFALEGGISQVETLSEKQMSNPEIISAFTSFLSIIPVNYQLIIGIDELDKIESDESARQFLNEIKSIFGIARCFYLISVSENAMNNFERRGLSFRDVFDSSFDSIVYVDYLNLEMAQILLQRRVIGKPIPFFCLAYCFAGGLPRDIIRYFREIINLSDSDKNLAVIAEKMISSDIGAKTRAISFSVKKTEHLPEVNVFLTTLLNVASEKPSKTLFETNLKALGDLLQTVRPRLTPETDEAQSQVSDYMVFIKLIEEIDAYFKFIAVLWTLFSASLTEEIVIKFQQEEIFDLVSKARQSLSQDHSVSEVFINKCKSKVLAGLGL